MLGKQFGRWTVTSEPFRRKTSLYVLCVCQCGTVRAVAKWSLTVGCSTSCGCYLREVAKISPECRRKGHTFKPVHGEANRTPEYCAFKNARKRCNNKNGPDYPDYGGRGIEFRFSSYQEFLAEVSRRPSKRHSLDRIDVNGHYEVGNLRWATTTEQRRNRRR